MYLTSKTDTTIWFGLYDSENLKTAGEKTVDLLKDELNVTLLEFKVNPPAQYSLYIKGEDFNVVLDKKTRFEVVPIETWGNPEDIDGNKVLPRKQGQEIVIDQDIEKFRFLHITAKKGVLYINKMILPLYIDEVDVY